MTYVETEEMPVWVFLFEALVEQGLRITWNYVLELVKRGMWSPFATVNIIRFKADEDNSP